MSDLMANIQEYMHEKIAVYGLGVETGKILPGLKHDFQIVGLLDGAKTEGELYGMPIISLETAVEGGVRLILVVARPGSCKAIAKRIGKVCVDKGIALIDVRGNDLLSYKKISYHFRDVDGITRKDLLQLTGKYEVISVDLFDTLIMRHVMFPTDIFTIVDSRLKEKGCYIDGFCVKRLESEKCLSGSSAPTLTEIYEYMVNTYNIPNINPGSLADLEWSVDCETVVARMEMCSLLKEIYNSGKEIYIVSDTFYRKEQVEHILRSCDIDFYTDILASCEYGTGKTQQLFLRLKEKISGRSCLHIGDDLVADIENAGINDISACRIYSGIDLLEMSGYLGLWDRIDTLSDRLKTGMLISSLFNSPFQFETKERKISVSRAKDIGYLFLAPVISDFVIWFARQVRNCSIENVWFCARDGYLIKKLYDCLVGTDTSEYFLTSRTAAVRAGMETSKDIAQIGEMNFSGTLEEQIRERFGIKVEKNHTKTSLSDYYEMILKHSEYCRKNHKKYIERLDLADGDIAFFDFVAKGTCQAYTGRLINHHIKGFYFLRLEEDNMREMSLDITPFYTNEERDTSEIFDNYYILETMLTSPEPSIVEFDENGAAVYNEESRTKADIGCFLNAQEGIFEYFQTYLKLCPKEERKIDKKIDEIFLSLIHKISILDKDFLNLTVEDTFFNRMTDITDLI